MSDECGHAKPYRPRASRVRRQIAHAEARCTTEGERWTEPRRRVFELLLKAAGPIKAYDLIAAFDEKAPGSTRPPTVYRALEFLEGVGLAHRIPSLNAYVACPDAKKTHAASFLICECCGRAEEFEPAGRDVTSKVARDRGFEPRTVVVEIRGVCHICAAKGDDAA